LSFNFWPKPFLPVSSMVHGLSRQAERAQTGS